MNAEEKVVAKLVICLSGIFGLVPFLSEFAPKSEYQIYLKFALFAAAFLIVFFGKEKILLFIINHIPAAKANRSIDGNWTIKISFEESESESEGEGETEEKIRTGAVKFESSLIGVKVKGDKLLNPKTDKVTMNYWYAENAEIVTYEGHDVLYYLYKIPFDKKERDDKSSKYQKVGYVCAIKKKNEDVFVGFFHDITVTTGDGDKKRTGKVVFSKNRY